MAECFRGQASVAHGLLEQCAQGVPELVGVKRRDPEPVCELAADVLCAGDGQPVGAGGFGAASSTGSEQRIKHVPLHLTGGVVGGAGAAQRRRESQGTDPRPTTARAAQDTLKLCNLSGTSTPGPSRST